MRRIASLAVVLASFALGVLFARGRLLPPAPVAHAAASPSLQWVGDMPFPPGFEPYGGVEPSVFFGRDGAHVIAAQGTYNGQKERFGWYVFKWYPGRAGGAVQLGDGMVTTGRGTLEVADRRLWAWGFQGNRLRIFQVMDWVSPDDAQNAYVP
jgi:hypothetical protein